MAILSTQIIETLNSQDTEQISTKQLVRNFGQSNDLVVLKILDQQGNYCYLMKISENTHHIMMPPVLLVHLK